MQNIFLDVAELNDQDVLEAPRDAFMGWIYMLAHCTTNKTGGVIPKDTRPFMWARILPPGVSLGAVIEAGLVNDDGHGNWAVRGYHLQAERGHTLKQIGGQKGAAKRWGNGDRSPNGIPIVAIHNGIPNRNVTVRKTGRKTASTSESESERRSGRPYLASDGGSQRSSGQRIDTTWNEEPAEDTIVGDAPSPDADERVDTTRGRKTQPA